MVKTKFLQSHSLFGGLSAGDIKAIRPLLKEESFPEGEYIVKQGEPGDRLYFIHQGSVEIVRECPSPQGPVSRRMMVLGAGDTFGEMELIDVQPRAASVRALKKVTALTLSNADMYQIYKSNLKAYTLIIMNIAREISRRLRETDILLGGSLYAPPRNPPTGGDACSR
jgi:CRP-like cAMP-binding protein